MGNQSFEPGKLVLQLNSLLNIFQNNTMGRWVLLPPHGPIFILKKELLSIPLFGLYLRKIGSVAIIRETTTKENLNFFDKIKKYSIKLFLITFENNSFCVI
mgnify:CR=1 FL=1